MLSLFGSGHVFQLIPSTSCHISFQTRVCIRTACELMSRIVCAFKTLLHCRSLQHNVTLQRTLPCTSHPEPRSNATRMLQSPATKCRTGAAPATQRHAATHMQRIPCTSHPDPHSNATRMLQSTAPANKCHTGVAPQRHTATHPSLHQPPRATLQRYQDASITCHQMSHWFCACHTTSHCNVHATYHSLHQPPRATLQRYQDASIDCACHQMSHWCCACHTTSQFNVPFPAPATQIHAATGSVTCTSEPISRVQASQFHVYKRTRARSEPLAEFHYEHCSFIFIYYGLNSSITIRLKAKNITWP